MGILCQPVLDKTEGSVSSPFPSVRMARLFNEFLSRYYAWKNAKRQEMIWIFIALFLGLSFLFIPWLLPDIWMTVSFIMLLLFYFATRRYLNVNEQASHLYVNVHILHHHLIGKLEVGFCDHREPCHCVENFRSHVMENYGILLDKGFIK